MDKPDYEFIEYKVAVNSTKEYIEVGRKYKIDYGEGNLNNKIIHILAIVDDDMFVYKWYGNNKRRMPYYKVENAYSFSLMLKGKNIKKLKGKAIQYQL